MSDSHKQDNRPDDNPLPQGEALPEVRTYSPFNRPAVSGDVRPMTPEEAASFDERLVAISSKPAPAVLSRKINAAAVREAKPITDPGPGPEAVLSETAITARPGNLAGQEGAGSSNPLPDMRVYSVFNRAGVPIQEKAMTEDDGSAFEGRVLGAGETSLSEPTESLEQPPGQRQPKSGRGSGVLSGLYALLIFFGAVLALTMASQIATLAAYVTALPAWMRVPAWSLLGLIIAVLLVGAARVVWLFITLPKSPNIPLHALHQLQARAETRAQAAAGAMEAAQQIRKFIEAYPAAQNVAMSRKPFGFSSEELQGLAQARARLLSGNHGDALSWLQQCDQQFLRLLDEKAIARVSGYAKIVGLKTALLSNPVFETGVIVANGYLLIGDLCRIYNLSVSRVGAATIMLHIVLSAAIAANVEDALDHAIDAASGSLHHDVGTALAASVAGAVPLAKRGAKGWVAYVLIRRLGAVTIRELRPIRKR
ncbi:MAG: DUF697 domain-containing protein [Verrucomicrobia bacterium]|nr:DUF697 domain-containing protein [Verrucomicrobiota bacterium]